MSVAVASGYSLGLIGALRDDGAKSENPAGESCSKKLGREYRRAARQRQRRFVFQPKV